MKLYHVVFWTLVFFSSASSSKVSFPSDIEDGDYWLEEIIRLERNLPKIKLVDSIKNHLKAANIDELLVPVSYKKLVEASYKSLEFPIVVKSITEIQKTEDDLWVLFEKCDIPFNRERESLSYFLRKRNDSRMSVVIEKSELWAKVLCLEEKLNVRAVYWNRTQAYVDYSPQFFRTVERD